MPRQGRRRWLAAIVAVAALAAAGTDAAAAQAAPGPPGGVPGAPGNHPGPLDRHPHLQSSYTWSSSDQLIVPRPDAAHPVVDSVKDPSVVFVKGKYHVFATVHTPDGWSMIYTSFDDWSRAGTAPQTYLDTTAIGKGYNCAPEVFYFAPQKKWYLIFQNGNSAYSTNSDISDPNGWSAPKNFYPAGMPDTIKQNIGNGYWVDMWVICDRANCHLFSSDDNGHLYRSQTSVRDFPNGMSEPVIAKSETNRFDLFEASNVYKVAGTNRYLLIVEAIGSSGSRYFRSWTSTSLTGEWTPLADTESNPFAGASNVTFPGGKWTDDISHGELVRTHTDQTLTIDPCRMRYLYQGRDPANDGGGDYGKLPYRLGLLTQTNSTY